MSSAAQEWDLSVQPLTTERWSDLERLFGERGACGGCWCMWWRLPRKQFEQQKGPPNRAALRALAESGPAPGLLGYRQGQPIAWCAVGPRACFPTLERSRTFKRLDDMPVWSVVCLFVARPLRHMGISVALLRAAAAYSQRQGATILEGYPVVPRAGALPDAFAWTGTLSAFQQADFAEVRRAGARAIVRRALTNALQSPPSAV
jgi:GNAT superfamily N-acetyltransferase